MPASTILLLDADPASAEAISPTLTGVGYTVTVDRPTPTDAFARSPDHQLVIIDVVDRPEVGRSSSAARSGRRPPWPRVPVAVHQPDRRRRGADRASSRPAPTTSSPGRSTPASSRRASRRCCSASSDREDMAPVFSADGLTLARARRTSPSTARRAASGRRPSPPTSRSPRPCAGPTRSSSSTSRSSSAASRATSTWSRADPRRRRPRRDRDARAGDHADRTRSATTRGLHVLAAPGTPEGADLVTPEHIATILKNLLEGYDSIVIDAGSVLDERSMTALEAAETVDPAGLPGDRGAEARCTTCSTTSTRSARSRRSRRSC